MSTIAKSTLLDFILLKFAISLLLETFDNIDVAKISLYNIVSLEEERGRTYYVDNDFFNNKYAYNHNR